MKVPGSDGSQNEARRTGDVTSGNQGVLRRGVARDQADSSSTAGSNQASVLPADSVQVSAIGALLRDELDATKMAEERRQKIAALKQQIQNGTYSPPADAVAQALGEELSLEILFAPKDNS